MFKKSLSLILALMMALSVLSVAVVSAAAEDAALAQTGDDDHEWDELENGFYYDTRLDENHSKYAYVTGRTGTEADLEIPATLGG